MKAFLSTIILFCIPFFLSSQIRLENPSFEGIPQDATVPTGWMPCELGTTPDILPGYWGVHQEASDGDTFMGLITRADGTFESVGQRLKESLEKGECYSMEIDLAKSNTYSGYNQSLKIRVWGAFSRCQKASLLYESPIIHHAEWERYSFSFIPKFQYHYIIIEAYSPKGKISKGNVLIDNVSHIHSCKRV